MLRKRKRRAGGDPKLEMTPMIDVVFQLLIFFIVTLKPEDILSHLDVSRPAPDAPPKEQTEEVDLLTVQVYKDGFVMNGRIVSLKTLDSRLSKLASYNSNVSVIIKCTGDSPHAYLVNLLDICAKNDLKNLAVFSM